MPQSVPAQDEVLRVQNLHKVCRNGTQALDDVEFSASECETVVLLGANGSGKSTL